MHDLSAFGKRMQSTSRDKVTKEDRGHVRQAGMIQDGGKRVRHGGPGHGIIASFGGWHGSGTKCIEA